MSQLSLTVVDLLHVALDALHTLMDTVEWSQPHVSLHFCPGGNLVDASLRAPHLRRLHGGGSTKLVQIFLSMLHSNTEKHSTSPQRTHNKSHGIDGLNF